LRFSGISQEAVDGQVFIRQWPVDPIAAGDSSGCIRSAAAAAANRREHFSHGIRTLRSPGTRISASGVVSMAFAVIGSVACISLLATQDGPSGAGLLRLGKTGEKSSPWPGFWGLIRAISHRTHDFARCDPGSSVSQRTSVMPRSGTDPLTCLAASQRHGSLSQLSPPSFDRYRPAHVPAKTQLGL